MLKDIKDKGCPLLDLHISRYVAQCTAYARAEAEKNLRKLAEKGDCQFNCKCGKLWRRCPIAKQTRPLIMPKGFLGKVSVNDNTTENEY